MNDQVLREELVKLLLKEQAHASLEKAVTGVKRENRCRRPAGAKHSPWELVEHLRLAQEDILRYTLDAGWKSPDWPEGYWPKPADDVDETTWNRSVGRLLADLQEVVDLVRDTSRDLTAQIPHGEGRTYLRQVMLVADHNAYHGGQLVEIRKQLGDW